jgi:membrane-associated phospholipid phosphatase
LKKILIPIIPIFLFFSLNTSFSQYRTLNNNPLSNNQSASNPSTSTIESENLDVKLFRSINGIESNFLDKFVSINDKSLMGAAILAPVGLFTSARMNGNTYDENSAVLLAASEFTSVAVSQSLKFLFQRDRPYTKLKNVYSNPNNSYTDKYCFPSGHTSLSFGMATSLSLRYSDDPLFVAGMYAYATSISLGRVYMGVHYPSDVLVGMIVGAGSAVLVHSFRHDIIKFKNNIIAEHKEDINQKGSLSAPVVFGSIIATDVLNFILSSSSNKNLKKASFNINSTSISNNLNFTYNF